MPITPEILFGYSKEERANKYQEIIDNLTKQLNELNSEKEEIMQEGKKLSKAKFKKEEPKIRKILDNIKEVKYI